MAANFLTTFSNAFSLMKMYKILIKISLKFVPKGPINNIPALAQIMAWRHPCDTPLSEPMMVRSLTYICITRPQWVKSSDDLPQSLTTIICCTHRNMSINTLRPRQNGRHFADDIFKRIFLNENILILIQISLKFVPKGSINNIPALVQIMAWRRTGDKQISEPMMTQFNDAYMRYSASLS